MSGETAEMVLWNMDDVLKFTGIRNKKALYRMIQLGQFPRGAKLGDSQKWIADQVKEHIRKMVKQANRI